MGDATLELAYKAIENHLKAQTDAFLQFRNRATTLFSAAAIVATLSTSIGFVKQKGGPSLPAWAPWVLLALLAAIGATSMIVIWPVRSWNFCPPYKLVLERHAARTAIDTVLIDSINEMKKRVDSNNQVIAKCSVCLQISASLFFGEMVTLVIAAGMR
ncbi:hypothetical protein U5640_27655 [Streptomyces sp. SS7]|uniref:hypothetical protein n=1 Tax=Streptomyces sp. SS7 TaxID=3108485 RepID=UPI0030EECAD6